MSSKKRKPKSLYYMFPSTKAEARNRFYRNIIWSIVVGISTALIFLGIMHLTHRF